MNAYKKILIVGSGNVAYHFVHRLNQLNYSVGVLSRNQDTGEKLAQKLDLIFYSNWEEISPNSFDLIIVCVSDGQINYVLEKAPTTIDVIITSGATSLSQFNRKRTGVLYPLQTFSKERTLNFETIPLFIEANEGSFKEKVVELANNMSTQVFFADTTMRNHLHLAGVLVNNFTNHLYHLADKHLASKNIPFEYLLPLIEETINKVKEIPPKSAQTGPAVRGDESTIEKHLSISDETLRELYLFLTSSIKKEHHAE